MENEEIMVNEEMVNDEMMAFDEFEEFEESEGTHPAILIAAGVGAAAVVGGVAYAAKKFGKPAVEKFKNWRAERKEAKETKKEAEYVIVEPVEAKRETEAKVVTQKK